MRRTRTTPTKSSPASQTSSAISSSTMKPATTSRPVSVPSLKFSTGLEGLRAWGGIRNVLLPFFQLWLESGNQPVYVCVEGKGKREIWDMAGVLVIRSFFFFGSKVDLAGNEKLLCFSPPQLYCTVLYYTVPYYIEGDLVVQSYCLSFRPWLLNTSYKRAFSLAFTIYSLSHSLIQFDIVRCIQLFLLSISFYI